MPGCCPNIATPNFIDNSIPHISIHLLITFSTAVDNSQLLSRLFISASSSPEVAAPVSLSSRSTDVIFGRPLPRCPWVGSHSIRQCAPSSGRLRQCPDRWSLLAAILSLSRGSLPYSFSFVTLSLQCTLTAFLSILE